MLCPLRQIQSLNIRVYALDTYTWSAFPVIAQLNLYLVGVSRASVGLGRAM